MTRSCKGPTLFVNCMEGRLTGTTASTFFLALPPELLGLSLGFLDVWVLPFPASFLGGCELVRKHHIYYLVPFKINAECINAHWVIFTKLTTYLQPPPNTHTHTHKCAFEMFVERLPGVRRTRIAVEMSWLTHSRYPY